jgi:hypothetical protein
MVILSASTARSFCAAPAILSFTVISLWLACLTLSDAISALRARQMMIDEAPHPPLMQFR